MNQRYGVWCVVSGGVTGWREAWLKGEGGCVLFDTLAEAEAEAAKHNKNMNASPYRTAYFRYEALEFDGGW